MNSYSNTVFVGPDGSDSYDGSLEQPFLTIGHAVALTGAGDTIFLLEGNYILTSTVSINSSESGLPENPCYLLAFQGDRVILDFYRQEFGDRGISLGADYWFIKGLVICNSGDNGMHISGNHNRIEQCIFYGNDDSGLQISNGGSYNHIINCDSYNNADPDNGDADGFAAKLDIGPGNEFHGCRSWNNSDDGWDLFEADDSVVVDHCWTFRNGYLPNESESVGEGNGFKLGGNYVRGNHLVKNCISFDNKRYGFHQNNNIGLITIYNSIAWNNGRNYNFNNDTIRPNILTNNISFNSGSADKFDQCAMTTNSWQGIAAGEDDFLSLMLTHAKDHRMPDGSLPSNTFCRLVPSSNLIEAGTYVGDDFTGTAPDLGPFEVSSPGSHIQLNIFTDGNGGVWISPPGGIYNASDEVELIAWNGKNFIFEGWTGDINESNDTVNIIMDTSKSVTAHFIPSSDIISDSLRIEAEDMVLQNYIFERITEASNGKVIRPTIADFCIGQVTYTGISSWHRVNVIYQDVATGSAQYRILVNGTMVGSWEGDSVSSGNAFVSKPFINIYLSEGDLFQVESKPGGQEYGKIDCIDLIKSEFIPDISIIQSEQRDGLKIYPNPFTSILTLDFSLNNPSPVKLEIFNMLGEKVISKTIDTESFKLNYDGSQIEPGLYLVRLISQDGTILSVTAIKE